MMAFVVLPCQCRQETLESISSKTIARIQGVFQVEHRSEDKEPAEEDAAQ